MMSAVTLETCRDMK